MTTPIKGSVVFVTGATGGIGQALIETLKARGAARIYAAARNVSAVPASENVVPIALDVTSDEGVTQAAATAKDVTLLINNAGVNHNTSFLRAPDLQLAREEIDVNYLALLRVTRAFAPTLIAHHGAVLNVLALLARVNLPSMGSYCASKAAALSLTQGLRGEFAPMGVRVAAVLPGAIDTRMTAGLTLRKMGALAAAEEALDGFEAGAEDIYVGDMARELAAELANDAKAVERRLASGTL
ncbi:SDR family oxidoreductase [Burkholderia diffusa]|uniref:SDR family oxidoreductase n=1 Tax=Burkholderia diffusa TaxID=488732 RepID=UPI002ABD7F02|nr:SDR family oxidoreductase [Burkholderia diffusa]